MKKHKKKIFKFIAFLSLFFSIFIIFSINYIKSESNICSICGASCPLNGRTIEGGQYGCAHCDGSGVYYL